jgi:hypothetical protein
MTKYNLITHVSSMTGTRTRVEDSCESGLCPICIADCPVFCEVSKSALRGREALYPLREYFGKSTAGTPKDFGLSFSDFQIQFSCRGAQGIEANEDKALFPNVDITTKWGKIPQKLPFIIPGLGSTYVARQNWDGLAMGAALSGICLTVGENVVGMDPNAKFTDAKPYPQVISSEDMEYRIKTYRQYWDGKNGDIIVQKNIEDGRLGVFNYVHSKLDVTSLEIKFGQGAKAIGGEVRLESLEKAQMLAKRGYLVIPDPLNPDVIEAWKKGLIQDFERHSRVGLSSTEDVLELIDKLRSGGTKNIFIKTGGYRPSDTAWIIRMAVEGKVDGLTVDGAGGGTGMSPVNHMNEGSIPTVYLEALVTGCLDLIKHKTPSAKIPTVAIAGGIANETQGFKAMCMGAPYVRMVGLARAPITAAMKSKYIGQIIKDKKATPAILRSLGLPDSKDPASLTLSEAFVAYDELKRQFGKEIPPEAVGVYTYFTQRLGTGIKHLCAGVRKFKLDLLERSDIAALSKRAIEVVHSWNLGIHSQEYVDIDWVRTEILSGKYN